MTASPEVNRSSFSFFASSFFGASSAQSPLPLRPIPASNAEIVRIPNAALRFYPLPEQVRPEDRPILEFTESEPQEGPGVRQSAMDKVEAARRRRKRHVWIQEGTLLRAIAVEIGLSDSRFSELISGDVREGMALVTRLDTTTPGGPAQ